MKPESEIVRVPRNERRIDLFQDLLFYAALAGEPSLKLKVPKSYKQTLLFPQKDEWAKATKSEIDSFWHNKTGVFISELPAG
jgi:hypothetical protein